MSLGTDRPSFSKKSSEMRVHAMNTTKWSMVVSLFALVLTLGSANNAHAQVLYGSVSGTIVDQSGAAVETVGLVAFEVIDKHFIREVVDH